MKIEVTLKFTLAMTDDVDGISPELEAVAWASALRRGFTEDELADVGVVGIVRGTRSLKVTPRERRKKP